jgi:hypothetical protein
VKVKPLESQIVFDLNDDTTDDNVMVLPYPTIISISVKHNGVTTLRPLVLDEPHEAHLSFSMCHPTLSNFVINSLINAKCFPTPMPFDVASSSQFAPIFRLVPFDIMPFQSIHIYLPMPFKIMPSFQLFAPIFLPMPFEVMPSFQFAPIYLLGPFDILSSFES